MDLGLRRTFAGAPAVDGAHNQVPARTILRPVLSSALSGMPGGVGQPCLLLTAADFNGDGALDLICANLAADCLFYK